MGKHAAPGPERVEERKPPGFVRRGGRWGRKTVLSAVAALIVAGAGAVAVNMIDVPHAEDAVRDRSLPALAGSLAQGDALQITLGQMKDVTGRWSVVFPRSASTAATPFMVEQPYESLDTYAVIAKELAAGAYAVDGMTIHVTIEGKRNEAINITNVRPVVVRREPPIDGPSIYMGTEGGGYTDNLSFDLDSPQPVAQEIHYPDPIQPFFDHKRITLKNGETDSLVLDLSAVKAAYSFVIAVDYEVGGKQLSQTLDMNGQPFRVTPSLCSEPIDSQHQIPPAVLADRAKLRYSSVLYSHVDPTTYSYNMVKGDPANFCSATFQDQH